MCDILPLAPARALNQACSWLDDRFPDGDGFQRKWPLPNVWLGTSCEDQAAADARVPELLATPAAIRFVSAEPLLGPIDFTSINPPDDGYGYGGKAAGANVLSPYNRCLRNLLDWIIVGGESGRHARPMHPAWARSIRDQCTAAGVAFHFKQNGEWAPTHPDWPRATPMVMADDGTLYRSTDLAYPDGARYGEAIRAGHDKARLTSIYRVGKRVAGRLLDDVEHNGFPEVRA